MKKTLCILLFVSVCWSCAQNSGTEKYQKDRNNIINVRNNIKEIEIEEVLISESSDLALINEYLIIGDAKSYDKVIHLFDKNKFNYVISTGSKGEGPDEITNMGYLGVDEPNNTIYVPDYGKLQVVGFNLDSVLINPFYVPKAKVKIDSKQFFGHLLYINDSLCIGSILTPIGISDFNLSLAKWNMNTGKIQHIEYEHPDLEKRRVTFAVSVENDIYVECYEYYDLMTICDLNGNLKYNIYGRGWDSKTTNKKRYYGTVSFCGDKIFTTYLGDDAFVKGQSGQIKSSFPTKFHVFNINGDYLQTLETEYKIKRFCYDKENNRIIMSLDDEMQFAYLNLGEIAV